MGMNGNRESSLNLYYQLDLIKMSFTVMAFVSHGIVTKGDFLKSNFNYMMQSTEEIL